jgi:CPA1 family monovalent cation:H+ antiporter
MVEPTVRIVFAVIGLLALTSLLLPAARALRLPYTVLLAALGLGLGLAAVSLPTEGGLAGDFMAALGAIKLSANALLYLFLPPLLFAVGLTIDTRRLMDDLGAVVLLAVGAVLVCTLVIGLWLPLLTDQGLLVCLLLGAVVATTDSAAVVAIFRDLAAPRRLSILVEGESLFNDAAAITVFAILIQILGAGGQPGILWPVLHGIAGFGGGIVFGFIAARVAGVLIARLRDMIAAEITLTIALAYLTYILAESYLGISGVMAVVSAAMTFAATGRTQVSPGTWPGLVGMWRMLNFWATSLVFCLAAMFVPEAVGAVGPQDLIVIAALFLGTLIARAIVLYGAWPALRWARLAQPISDSYKLVIWWGGVRGAVTIALALAVNETAALPEGVRRFVLVGATGYVLATLFINAPTLRPLMRLIGLKSLTGDEHALAERARLLAQTAVRSRLEEQPQRTLAVVAAARPEAEGGADPSQAGGVEAGLLAIAAREGELYLDYFAQGIVSRRIADNLRAVAGRLHDAAKTDGIPGYARALRLAFRSGRTTELALWLHRRVGLAVALEVLLADRLEMLLAMERADRDLDEFLRHHLSGMLAPSALDKLTQLIADRGEALAGAMEIIEIQYTNYFAELRDRQLARTRLYLEAVEYQRQRRLSLIPADVYEALEANRRERLKRLEARPRLDIGDRLRQMIKAVPAFAEIGEGELVELVRMLKPRMVAPGERVIAKGQRGSSMFFIASGRLHVELEDRSLNLASGEFVGELALLTGAPRNATVVARGFAYLFELEANDLKRIMRRSARLKSVIEKRAHERLAGGAPHAAEGQKTSAI